MMQDLELGIPTSELDLPEAGDVRINDALKLEDWSAWLHLSKPEATLLSPLPKGSLEVEQVRQGSD